MPCEKNICYIFHSDINTKLHNSFPAQCTKKNTIYTLYYAFVNRINYIKSTHSHSDPNTNIFIHPTEFSPSRTLYSTHFPNSFSLSNTQFYEGSIIHKFSYIPTLTLKLYSYFLQKINLARTLNIFHNFEGT